MQVPAYCPGVLGVHDIENRGVLVEVKNTIAIESIPFIVSDPDDIGIELLSELDIDILDIVLVGELDVDVVMPISLMPLIVPSMIVSNA